MDDVGNIVLESLVPYCSAELARSTADALACWIGVAQVPPSWSEAACRRLMSGC
jgi:hypothetical protein